MRVFDTKQIKILRGNLTDIADSLGCSVQYVMKVVKNKAPQNTELAKKIIEKAEAILEIFETAEV